MEQAKIRPSVTLYSLDRSLPNLVRLITSANPTRMPILIEDLANGPRLRQVRFGYFLPNLLLRMRRNDHSCPSDINIVQN